ncbi:hypothetical protein [Aquamicrobium sp.]|uniref:hypothetical protein n=1 Tax=Aquamicrobium sp. TaxID=1872579 RepID=UPI00258B38E0|nr:hypothetical protein [Aquamicrobium sp.]MCK9551158.1 hypothetical protein [Aquamicrobium sp.]
MANENKRELKFSVIEEVKNQYTININEDCKMSDEEIMEKIYEVGNPWHVEGHDVIVDIDFDRTLNFLNTTIESFVFEENETSENIVSEMSNEPTAWSGYLKMSNDAILKKLYIIQDYLFKELDGDHDIFEIVDSLINNFHQISPLLKENQKDETAQTWEGHLKMSNDDISNELYNAQAFVLKIVNGDTSDIGEDEEALKSLDKVIDNFNPDGPPLLEDEDSEYDFDIGDEVEINDVIELTNAEEFLESLRGQKFTVATKSFNEGLNIYCLIDENFNPVLSPDNSRVFFPFVDADLQKIEHKCILCGGKLLPETESDCAPFYCKDCDCLQDLKGNINSDISFYLVDYDNDENIEIFIELKDAKKYANGKNIYQAILNHERVYLDGGQWIYDDKSDLFINTPVKVEV